MDVEGAAALGISCSARCAGAGSKLAFEESVQLTVPASAGLVRLSLEFAELRGVGNWASGAQFAVDGGQDEWVFSTGLRDPTIVPIYDAIVAAFTK